MIRMRIGLVTDSNSDLPDDLIQRYQVEVIPNTLVLDGLPYLDGVEISRSDFYNRLPDLRQTPTTAAPSQTEFSARYRKLFAAGCEHVIGIFTAEKLTAIPNIARLAAAETPGKVSVIESGSLSMGVGYQVLAAAQAIEHGQPLAEVLRQVQSVRERIKLYAALDTLEYMRRSGRVPQAVSALGGLLKIKPVIELREGVVRPVDAPRTTGRATEKLISLLVELQPFEHLTILHTNAGARAREFLERIENMPGLPLPEKPLIVNVTSVIGTHVGPNGLGIALVRNRV